MGCGALAILADNDQRRIKTAHFGGIETILNAMREHGTNLAVQGSGCNALAGLASQNEENCMRIIDQGGISAIRAAMERHGADAHLQVIGKAALKSLACPIDAGRTGCARWLPTLKRPSVPA